jgi:hypothetical protein
MGNQYAARDSSGTKGLIRHEYCRGVALGLEPSAKKDDKHLLVGYMLRSCESCVVGKEERMQWINPAKLFRFMAVFAIAAMPFGVEAS